jgi:hypothetical protein
MTVRVSVAAAALIGISAGLAAQRPDTSVRAVAAAAERYLGEYQQQLTYLLADEETRQQVFDASGARTAERRTTGELFVTFVPADRAWLAVHDVAALDGRAVPDREDLRRLLAEQPASAAARTLIARNARYNIGSIIRNFNEPTLGLLVFEARRRAQFRFDRERVERQPGGDLVTLRFRERDGPTLVRGVDGSDLFSTGEAAVDAASGRIQRTLIRVTYGPVVAQLTTTYALEPRLGVWAPATFTERYERTSGVKETIVCETTYTNWRKWGVDVRIR